MIIGKVRVLSLLAAGIVFVLPWLELQCSGQPFIRQSGFEIIYGGQRLAPEMEKQFKDMDAMGGGQHKMERSKNDISKSILIAVAFILVVFSLVAAFAAMGDSNPRAGVASGFLAALALALIVVQLLIGFPIEQELKKDMAAKKQEVQAKQPSDEASLETVANDMANQMTKNMFKIVKLPALYIELMLLAFPALLTAVSLRQLQEEGDERDACLDDDAGETYETVH